MKKVIVIFRNRRNPEAIQFMLNGIQAVFEDYIDLETVYVNELKPGMKLDADAEPRSLTSPRKKSTFPRKSATKGFTG